MRAVAYRLPEDLVIRIRQASTEAGLSATEYVRRAIEARLEAPSILEVPMVPREAPRQMIRPEEPKNTETCAHPFREDGRCRTCGAQL